MKKLFCLLLVFCILFCVGCTNTQGGDGTTSDPNGGETSGDLEPYTPEWHLSETVDEELLLSDASTDIGIRVPLVYEKTVSDVAFRFEFFEEFYPIGSMMQVRISMTNNSKKDIEYNAAGMLGHICRWENFEMGKSVSFRPVLDPNNGEKLEEKDYYADVVYKRNFLVGETLVFERAVRVSSEFFTVGEYAYSFPSYFGDNEIVKIPITVVNLGG